MRTTLHRLVNQGLVAEPLALARSLGSLTLEERVLRCELELLASNREAALKLAGDIFSREAPSRQVVRALVVAGRVEFYFGRISEGQQRFLRAKELASQLGDPSMVASTLGSYIGALLRYVSLEAAVGHLSQYRKAALRSGDGKQLATLHRVLAEAELKSGRSHRALRELELAAIHIDEAVDLVDSSQLSLTRSAVHGLLGDATAAYHHASQAVSFAETSGAHAMVRAALNNVSHFQVLLGRYEDASAILHSLAEGGPRSLDSELNRRNTQLMLATAMADHAAATEIDAEFGPIAAGKHTVAAQWYKLARAAYLTRSNRSTEALTQWRSCVGDASAVADRNYIDRFELVAAEAQLQRGELLQAVDGVASVSLGPQGRLPEFAASAHRVSGRLASDSPVAAFDHFSRAARIFGHIGHLVGRGESLHNAATLRASLAGNDLAAVPHITTFYTEPPPGFGRVDAGATPSASADAVAQALRATAAMVDLTSRPALSGYELLSLVSASGAAEHAVMVARRGPASEPLGWTGADSADAALLASSDQWVTFPLGNDGGRDVSVVVRPRNQGSARTTLLALQRLALNAASLHQAAVAESERSALWPEPLPEQLLGFVCASESMLELLSATRRVAASNFAVLITGETGTGKELLARAIHNSSQRSKQRFQPFNCTAVAREMLDAQLFGYKRGAFTGAHDSFPGVIRSAAGGTLLLDEIGEIGLDVQPKLLRFLESGEVHPLGEPAPVSVDVRVVAATNANLDKLVEEGKFRDDLFYRLNVVRLTIPPLRERREEIPLLLDHFLERAQKECGKSGIRVGETAAEYLLLYAWPGNVRELANEVRRAVALAEPGAVLMPEHLSAKLAATRRTVPVDQRPPDHAELVVRRDQPLTAAVEHVERALIQDALRRHANVEDAARALGLSRKGLYLKRQRLKIDE